MSAAKSVTMPMIHMGGTDTESLLNDYLAALTAAKKLMAALPSPNGRDYPTSPAAWREPESGTYDAAYADHMRRIDTIRGVFDELQAIVHHVAEEDGKRSAARGPRRTTFGVGDRVCFGRANGEKTEGIVISVNVKSVSIETTEQRGVGRVREAGKKWRVHPSLVSLAVKA